MSTRNPVYDIMKGIGIILVLIGHIPPGERLFHVIYSFHMPLFFIVAGFFASTVKMDFDVLKKYASRLLFPVLATMTLVVMLSPLHYYSDGNFNYLIAQGLSLIWAGDALPTRFGVLSLDSLWFLVALFWAKCLFQSLGYIVNKSFTRYQDELLIALCFVVSSGAIALHKIIPYVPWGVLKGMSAVWFFAVGWYIKRHRLPVFVFIACSLCWLLSLRFGSLNMVSYTYKVYPLEVFGAIGATWLVYLLSKVIHRYASWASRIFQWFGINSLLFLCVNALDRKTYLVRAIKEILNVHPTGLYNTMIHYSIELLLVIVFIYIPFSNRLFKAKKLHEIG